MWDCQAFGWFELRTVRDAPDFFLGFLVCSLFYVSVKNKVKSVLNPNTNTLEIITPTTIKLSILYHLDHQIYKHSKTYKSS